MFRQEFGLSMAEVDGLPWYEKRMLTEEYIEHKRREEAAYSGEGDNYDRGHRRDEDLHPLNRRDSPHSATPPPAPVRRSATLGLDSESLDGIAADFQGITVRRL